MKELLIKANYHFIQMVIERNDVDEVTKDLIETILIQSSTEGENLEMSNGLFVYGYITGAMGLMPDDSAFEGISNKEIMEGVIEMFDLEA